MNNINYEATDNLMDNIDKELFLDLFSNVKICAYQILNKEINPFFNVLESEKEELILREINMDYSTEEPDILEAIDLCRKLYETPTFRAYKGIASMLDRLARYMETTDIEHGRDGNINSLINAAAKFEQIRNSFKGAYSDLKNEQKTTVRGGQGLAYDQL